MSAPPDWCRSCARPEWCGPVHEEEHKSDAILLFLSLATVAAVVVTVWAMVS